MPPEIGVLALQGDFEAHRKAFERAGARVREVRSAADLAAIDALVLPGGESTTMLKLLEEENLLEPLRAFGERKPIFGTCAGAILLASEVLHPAQSSLGLVDMTIERNGYGRQIDSRIASIELEKPLAGKPAEAVFIRAPVIRRIGDSVHILARYGADPVLIEQGKHLAATFHPELSGSLDIHRYFLSKVARETAS